MDLESLAIKTIENLDVVPGQVFSIWASTLSLDLIGALAYHLRARGAFWTVRLMIPPLLKRVAAELPEEYLDLVPNHELRWLQDITAIIEVHDHPGHISGVELTRRRAMAAEWIALIDEAERIGCRRFTIVNPTHALAEAHSVALDTFQDWYWNAINVDDNALNAAQASLAQQIQNAYRIHITSPVGSDLRLEVGNRPIHQDHNGLPRGEVYFAPLETSCEGIAVIDQAFIGGQAIEQLKLSFSHGRVIHIDAAHPEQVNLLTDLLSASTGDKDRIAELGFGLNPGVKQLTGDILLDEKLYGSVHIAIGMNDHFGGQNHSNLHLDLVILHPSCYLDDTLI